MIKFRNFTLELSICDEWRIENATIRTDKSALESSAWSSFLEGSRTTDNGLVNFIYYSSDTLSIFVMRLTVRSTDTWPLLYDYFHVRDTATSFFKRFYVWTFVVHGYGHISPNMIIGFADIQYSPSSLLLFLPLSFWTAKWQLVYFTPKCVARLLESVYMHARWMKCIFSAGVCMVNAEVEHSWFFGTDISWNLAYVIIEHNIKSV